MSGKANNITLEEARTRVSKRDEKLIRVDEREKVLEEFLTIINRHEYVQICVDCLTKQELRKIAEQLKENRNE